MGDENIFKKKWTAILFPTKWRLQIRNV